MNDEIGTLAHEGQLERQTGANMGIGAQLACLTGLSFLSKLDDEEAAELAAHISNALCQASDAGYSDGWSEAQNYNCDMARLRSAGPTTEH